MDLRIEQREKEGIRILDLRGRLVIGDSESLLRTTLIALSGEGNVNIVLNFAEVKEVDDDGLGALVVCHANLRRAGGALKLLNLSRVHMELFISMKLSGVFEVFQDEQGAVNSFFPDRAVRSFDILEFVESQRKSLPFTPQNEG
jgi:anti-sigma B factor antagonist